MLDGAGCVKVRFALVSPLDFQCAAASQRRVSPLFFERLFVRALQQADGTWR
jgi:hypothetical protein